MSSSPPGVSRSSDGNYNSGELALCRHTNFSRGWISSRWCRADWRRWRRPPQSCNMNGNSPAETGRLVLRLGSFRLLAPDPSTTNYCHQKLHKRKTCASLQPIHPSLARRFIKKVMSMAIGRRTVGCRLHLPNWDAKYGGRTPLSGSLNKRPFWIFM